MGLGEQQRCECGTVEPNLKGRRGMRALTLSLVGLGLCLALAASADARSSRKQAATPPFLIVCIQTTGSNESRGDLNIRLGWCKIGKGQIYKIPLTAPSGRAHRADRSERPRRTGRPNRVDRRAGSTRSTRPAGAGRIG